MAIFIRRKGLGKPTVIAICKAMESNALWALNTSELQPDDVYIRWGCSSSVPATTVINSASAIHRVTDKKGFRMLLDQMNLCPKTWVN